MHTSIVACAAYDLQSIDIVAIDYKDIEALRAESEFGARLGFTGKQIIHPAQVEPVQAAFTPGDAVIAYAKRIRPDLFLGTYKTTLGTYTLTDSTPLPPEYEFCLKDYVVGRANAIDDEYSLDGRAGAFNQNFKTVLMTL